MLVYPTLAKVIGLDCAIFLQQLHYWLIQPERPIIDDLPWVYNSYDEWHIQFPWWSATTIKRIVHRLEQSGVLITRVMNKSDWDRRKWYTIDHAALDRILEEANVDPSKRSVHVDQADHTGPLLKETKTTTKKGEIDYAQWETPGIDHLYDGDDHE